MSLCMWLAVPIFLLLLFSKLGMIMKHLFPLLKTTIFKDSQFWQNTSLGIQRRVGRRGQACEVGPLSAEDSRQRDPGPHLALKGPGCYQVPRGSWTLRLWTDNEQLADPRTRPPPFGICPFLPSPMDGMWLFAATVQKKNTMNCFKISPG